MTDSFATGGRSPTDAAEGLAPDNGFERLLVNAVILFSFFPFFRYLPLGTVESQPIGGVIALLGLLRFGVVDRPVVRSYLALVGVMLASAVMAIFGLGVAASETIQQLAAYITPILTILFLWGRVHMISVGLVLASGISYIFIGILQYLGLIPGVFENLLSSMISRYQSDMVGGGRGVLMFTPEPSYAAKQILMFMAFIMSYWRDGKLKARFVSFLLIISMISMIVLNKSIIGIGLSAIFLFAFVFLLLPLRRRLVLGTLLVAVGFLIFSGLQSVDTSNITKGSPRIVQISVSFAQAFAKGTFGFKDIVQFGSARVVTNVGGLRAIPDGGLLGSGVGNSEAAVKRTMENDPLLSDLRFDSSRFNTLKPEGWAIAFIVETGLLGLVTLLIVVVRTLKAIEGETRLGMAASVAMLITSFTQILFLGPQSLPAPWITLVLATDNSARKRKESL